MARLYLEASIARKQADASKENGLNEVLSLIDTESKQGKYELFLTKYYRSDIIDKLRELGYKITSLPSIAYQKDGITYNIKW